MTPVSLFVYGLFFTRTWRGAGKVTKVDFGIWNAWLASLLALLIATTAIGGLTHAAPAKAPGAKHAISSFIGAGATELGVIVVIFALVMAHGIGVTEFLGLRRVKVWLAPLIGIGLAALLYPLIAWAAIINQLFIGKGAKTEPAVRIFKEAATHTDIRFLIFTVVFGVVIAPIFEELIFRAYLYPVLKRHLGFLPALLLVSALFAAIHATPAILAPIFILAVMLTLAYEATGSILVSISMHATFNAVQFFMLYYALHHLAHLPK